jgi:probable F420-dependent oxidoreductase
MHFGVHIIGAGAMADGDKLVEVAQKAEQLGYHSLWISDHLIFPRQLQSRYPYSSDGRMPLDPQTPRLESLLALTYVAAQTHSIKLGPSVLIVPYREPVLLAKQVASLDVLSKGRFIFGVGVGWMREEFAAVGRHIDARDPVTRECLALMKACWTQEVINFQGRFFTVSDMCMMPKPLQSPHPPIWFGGNTRAALRRTAELADGWHGAGLTPEELQPKLAILREECAKVGRQLSDLTISLQPLGKPITTETVEQYRALGVEMLLMPRAYRSDLPAVLDQLEKFAETVKRPAQKIAGHI